MKSNISIPKRVTIGYLQFILPILLVLFLLLAGTIYCFDSSNQTKLNQEFSHKVLEQANKTLKTWIDDQMIVLSMIVNDERVIAACANPADEQTVRQANEFLRSVHERNQFYENIALSAELPADASFELTAVDGKEYILHRGEFFADSSKGASIGKSDTEHPMAASIYKDGKSHVITHVYRSLIYGNPAFIISQPVYKNGKFVGAAHMALPMRYFTDAFVNDVKMGQTGYMFMIDDKGLLISHPNKELILNEEAAVRYQAVISRVLGGELSFSQQADGLKKTYNVMKFDFHGLHHVSDWYLVFVQNKQEILLSSVRFLWLVSAFLIVGFLLIIGVVYISTVKLLHLGFHDSLTGLYNRNYFEQESARLSSGRYNPVGFVGIDVDGLKLVNDTLGHGAGDDLLLTVGQTIKRSFDPDAIVLRFGGDEFGVLLLAADEISVQAACRRLRAEVSEYNQTESALPVSISLGWASGTLGPEKNIYQLMEIADQSMYKEKEGHRQKYAARFKEWLDQYGETYRRK